MNLHLKNESSCKHVFSRKPKRNWPRRREWYALQRHGLDSELMLRIDETLRRITEAPKAYPEVYRQIRRAVIRQFPFAIYYDQRSDEIRVIAVYHSKRNPKGWKSRV